MAFRPRPSPMTPIWNPDRKRGGVSVAGTPDPPDVFKVLGYVQNDTYLEGARHLATYGDYVIVGARNIDAVTVVDVSTPASPTIAGSVSDATEIGAVDGVAVAGTHAYVTRGTGNRISSISLATPATPTVSHSLSDGTNLDGAAGLDVSGSTAFVAAFDIDKVSAVDISNPASMSYAGGVTHASLGGAIDVVAIGDDLLVAARGDDSIVLLDVSTPASPTYDTDYLDGTLLDLVETLHEHDSNLWAWAPGYISSWEIGGVFGLDNLGELADSDLTQCFGMATLDGYLAVPAYASGQVKLVDTSDPEDPVVAHELSIPNGWLPWACAAVNGVLAVTCDGDGDDDPVVICGFD